MASSDPRRTSQMSRAPSSQTQIPWPVSSNQVPPSMASEYEQQQDTWARERGHRLPTFKEVLSRQTRPPVDLFMFYLFLQREGAEDVLDFWLDVQQHENLCRAYFKDIGKTGKTIKEEWPQFWDYARRRGSIYGTVVGIPAGKRSTLSSNEMTDAEKIAAAASERRSVSPRPSGPGSSFDWAGPTPVAPEQQRSSTPFSLSRYGRYSGKRGSRAPTIIHRDAPITQADLIASAERIFARYLVPTAEKEIYLPPSLRIHTFLLSSEHPPDPNSSDYETEAAVLAQVPDMFHAQKEYIFKAMEQDAFPRFLRAKAFGNLTPMSVLVRLIAGLLVLWAGLSTAFALIFLDIQPKSVRFWLFIPFFLAVLFLISYQYEQDPILIFFLQSETTPFRTLTIREPYVKKLLIGRAIWVVVLVSVLSSALTLIFWAVPGHRL